MSLLATLEDFLRSMGQDPPLDADHEDVMRARLALQEASDLFVSETHRRFDPQDTTVTLDGEGSTALLLPNPPIVEVTSATILDTNGDETEVDLTDLRLVSSSGVLHRLSTVWPVGVQNIEIELTSGFNLPGEEPDEDFPDLPGGIRAAVAAKAAELFTQNIVLASGSGPLTATSVSMGIYSESNTYADTSSSSTVTNFDPSSDWSRMVSLYRDVRAW